MLITVSFFCIEMSWNSKPKSIPARQGSWQKVVAMEEARRSADPQPVIKRWCFLGCFECDVDQCGSIHDLFYLHLSTSVYWSIETGDHQQQSAILNAFKNRIVQVAISSQRASRTFARGEKDPSGFESGAPSAKACEAGHESMYHHV